MRLSVIIACFNAAQTIGVQLEALALQTWCEPWEIIVADNGSTDDSRAVVEQFKCRLPNLKLIDASKVRGVAHARNVAVSIAQGESLAFCDADDEVAPGWVAAMGEALATYDFVACRREYAKLNEPWLLKVRSLNQQNGVQTYRYPPFLPHASSSALGVKRTLFQSIGGFDESMQCLSDTDFCWRLQLAGTKLEFVPNAVVHYRFRPNTWKICTQARKYGKYNVFLYEKYRSKGMPKLTLKMGLAGWWQLLRGAPKLLNSSERVRWLRDLSWRIGRLEGCLKYKLIAL
ncbi:glycosyltransferase [Oscillatoria sp. FACHB-1407]|uniref:glycosyltransferase family 2 protein n=1 Tax=Oscillatoria sp. FACHB-1407 TaxID=2692847 RepID=UPI001689F6C7|nr:glycosyltransferase [Oscillatoria sp. FACHB-1407]MBD2463756.1 glycosyltransferase [Oscillatoria sp. FACHB-1407]